jgi:CRP-like cAMP-binding protein
MTSERADLDANERDDLVDRLAGFESFSRIPRSELEWLVTHASLGRYEVGDETAHVGTPIPFMWICLSGKIAIDVDRGAGPRRAMEWGPGDVSGMLPYSRMSTTPGTAYAIEPTEALRISVESFPELTTQCPMFTSCSTGRGRSTRATSTTRRWSRWGGSPRDSPTS